MSLLELSFLFLVSDGRNIWKDVGFTTSRSYSDRIQMRLPWRINRWCVVCNYPTTVYKKLQSWRNNLPQSWHRNVSTWEKCVECLISYFRLGLNCQLSVFTLKLIFLIYFVVVPFYFEVEFFILELRIFILKLRFLF